MTEVCGTIVLRKRDRRRIVLTNDCVKTVKPDFIQTDFSADKLQPEVGETVQFTDLSTLSPSKHIWSLDDGNYSEQQNPSIAYQSTGKKTVRLHAGGTGSTAADAGNVAEKVDYIEVQKQAFITEAFIATVGDILNDSGSSASSGDSIETVEGEEEPTLNRDLSQTTGSQQPQGVEVNGVLALQGDGNDDFMRFLNVTRQDWEDLIAQGTFAISFMVDAGSDAGGQLEFGYTDGTSVFDIGIASTGAGDVLAARIVDDSDNSKRFVSNVHEDEVVVGTAVFNETGDFEIIINGTDEPNEDGDEGADFSQVDLSNNAEGPVYLARSGSSGVSVNSVYPCSKEFFVHDANSVSQGHHMEAHNFLRNLYGV